MNVFIVTTLVVLLTSSCCLCDAIPPTKYFYHANNIPSELYANYICGIFRESRPDGYTLGRDTEGESNYQAVYDFLISVSSPAVPVLLGRKNRSVHVSFKRELISPPMTMLASVTKLKLKKYPQENNGEQPNLLTIYESLKSALCSGLTAQQLEDLRQVLELSLTSCDLNLLVQILFSSSADKAMAAIDVIKPFLIHDAQPSLEALSENDKRKLFTAILVATNEHCGSSQGQGYPWKVEDIARAVFDQILPLELTKKQRDNAETAMIVLGKSSLRKPDIVNIFKHFIQGDYYSYDGVACQALYNFLDSLETCGAKTPYSLISVKRKCDSDSRLTTSSQGATKTRPVTVTSMKTTTRQSITEANHRTSHAWPRKTKVPLPRGKPRTEATPSIPKYYEPKDNEITQAEQESSYAMKPKLSKKKNWTLSEGHRKKNNKSAGSHGRSEMKLRYPNNHKSKDNEKNNKVNIRKTEKRLRKKLRKTERKHRRKEKVRAKTLNDVRSTSSPKLTPKNRATASPTSARAIKTTTYHKNKHWGRGQGQKSVKGQRKNIKKGEQTFESENYGNFKTKHQTNKKNLAKTATPPITQTRKYKHATATAQTTTYHKNKYWGRGQGQKSVKGQRKNIKKGKNLAKTATPPITDAQKYKHATATAQITSTRVTSKTNYDIYKKKAKVQSQKRVKGQNDSSINQNQTVKKISNKALKSQGQSRLKDQTQNNLLKYEGKGYKKHETKQIGLKSQIEKETKLQRGNKRKDKWYKPTEEEDYPTKYSGKNHVKKDRIITSKNEKAKTSKSLSNSPTKSTSLTLTTKRGTVEHKPSEHTTAKFNKKMYNKWVKGQRQDDYNNEKEKGKGRHQTKGQGKYSTKQQTTQTKAPTFPNTATTSSRTSKTKFTSAAFKTTKDATAATTKMYTTAAPKTSRTTKVHQNKEWGETKGEYKVKNNRKDFEKEKIIDRKRKPNKVIEKNKPNGKKRKQKIQRYSAKPADILTTKSSAVTLSKEPAEVRIRNKTSNNFSGNIIYSQRKGQGKFSKKGQGKKLRKGQRQKEAKVQGKYPASIPITSKSFTTGIRSSKTNPKFTKTLAHSSPTAQSSPRAQSSPSPQSSPSAQSSPRAKSKSESILNWVKDHLEKIIYQKPAGTTTLAAQATSASPSREIGTTTLAAQATSASPSSELRKTLSTKKMKDYGDKKGKDYNGDEKNSDDEIRSKTAASMTPTTTLAPKTTRTSKEQSKTTNALSKKWVKGQIENKRKSHGYKKIKTTDKSEKESTRQAHYKTPSKSKKLTIASSGGITSLTTTSEVKLGTEKKLKTRIGSRKNYKKIGTKIKGQSARKKERIESNKTPVTYKKLVTITPTASTTTITKTTRQQWINNAYQSSSKAPEKRLKTRIGSRKNYKKIDTKIKDKSAIQTERIQTKKTPTTYTKLSTITPKASTSTLTKVTKQEMITNAYKSSTKTAEAQFRTQKKLKTRIRSRKNDKKTGKDQSARNTERIESKKTHARYTKLVTITPTTAAKTVTKTTKQQMINNAYQSSTKTPKVQLGSEKKLKTRIGSRKYYKKYDSQIKGKTASQTERIEYKKTPATHTKLSTITPTASTTIVTKATKQQMINNAYQSNTKTPKVQLGPEKKLKTRIKSRKNYKKTGKGQSARKTERIEIKKTPATYTQLLTITPTASKTVTKTTQVLNNAYQSNTESNERFRTSKGRFGGGKTKSPKRVHPKGYNKTTSLSTSISTTATRATATAASNARIQNKGRIMAAKNWRKTYGANKPKDPVKNARQSHKTQRKTTNSTRKSSSVNSTSPDTKQLNLQGVKWTRKKREAAEIELSYSEPATKSRGKNTEKSQTKQKLTEENEDYEPTAQCGFSETCVSPSSWWASALSLDVGANCACRKHPWLVRLIVDYVYECTGAILDERHILTSGHCVSSAYSIVAIVGDYDASVAEDTEQYFRIDIKNGVSVHPSFDYVEPNNDIAMLTLSSPIDLTKPCARPLCFDPKFKLTPGQLCQTAGWDLDFEGVSTPYILKSATVATYLGTDCNSYAPITVHLTSPTKQICTLKPENGIDICIVGGGGPLFCQQDKTKQWTLVGVMAYSHTCLETRMANVFTNSLAYAGWIEHEMQRDL